MPRNAATHPRVILVDDEGPVLSAMGRILRNNDYDVRTFGSCQDALKHLYENDGLSDCDILVTDICMPSMNGAELGKLVNAARPDLPILYCSGQDVHRFEGVNDSNLLTKPFSVHELIERIDHMLGR